MSLISEQVQARANEALLSMLNGVESATEFAVEQAPEVVQELLMWHTIDSLLSTFMSVFWGVVLIVLPCVYGFGRKYRWQRVMWESGDGLHLLLVSFLCLIGLIVMVDYWSLTWLQILVAPKLYLLEYAATLVK